MSPSSASNRSRLVHSNGGLLRASQMQASECTIYVEGTDADLFYYSSVLRKTTAALGFSAEFRKSSEIGGPGEGKPRCLEYFQYLSANNQLISVLANKWTASLFFLDKDIDDIENLLINSPHICYTTHCCVENHIVRESNVPGAVAAAVSVTIEKVEASVGSVPDWLATCCAAWRDWISICILSKTLGVPIRNYSRKSQVQSESDDPESPTDSSKRSQYLADIERHAALSRAEWERKQTEVHALIGTLSRQGKWDSVFKGKWYGPFLGQLAKRVSGKATYNELALWAALNSQINAAHPESDVFRNAVINVATILSTSQANANAVPVAQ